MGLNFYKKIYKTLLTDKNMERGIFVFSILIFFVLIFSQNSLALGISPAIVEIDFAPNAEHEFNFYVGGDDPERIIDLDVGGDFAEYTVLNTKEIKGSGTFSVKLKFPKEAKKPGINRLSVGASERPPEESFLGTKAEIRATIIVRVPYPGRYAEVELTTPDGNVKTPIDISLKIYNRGKESLFIKSEVFFFDEQGKSAHYIGFPSITLEPNKDKTFRNSLNTTVFRPGNYLARAAVDYGEKVNVESRFRIGYFYVNITNFTSELPKRGIQKFFVNVESRWNGKIEPIYADINIYNETKNLSFRTPSIGLEAWGSATLEGFLDTEPLNGDYNVNIALNYLEEQSFASGKLRIYETEISLKFIIMIAAIIITFVLLVIFIIFRKLRKKGRKKNEKV